MNRPFKRGELLRVTTGKFRGWRGNRWACEQQKGMRYYSLHARYRPFKGGGKLEADFVGLGAIINIPENHLKRVIKE
jgi:hypothetical protein